MQSGASTEQLFVRFRETGDPDAFRLVFERTAEDLVRVAQRWTNDRTRVDDLVQDTYLTALHSSARFDPKQDLSRWLTAILRNTARNAHRYTKRRETVGGEVLHGVPAPARQMPTAEVRAIVETTLQQLPGRYRAVLHPYLIEELSAKEIAARLDCSHSTVRSRISRGLHRLRGALPRGLASVVLGSILLPRLVAERGTAPAVPHAAEPGDRAAAGSRSPRRRPTGTALVAGATVLLLAWGAVRYWSPAPRAPRETPLAGGTSEDETPMTTAAATPRRVERAAATTDDDARCRLTVRIVSRATGAPVAGALLALQRQSRDTTVGASLQHFFSAITDDAGEAAFRVRPGAWGVRFGEANGSPVYEVDRNATVEVPVDRVVTLRGSVTTLEGAIAREAQLWIGDPELGFQPPQLAAVTDNAGRFEVRLPEAYRACLWARGKHRGCSEAVRPRLARRATWDVRFVLAPASGAVRGAVFDRSARPAPAWVGLYPVGAHQRSTPPRLARAEAGEFHFDALPAGDYLLAALGSDDTSGQRRVRIEADRVAGVDLRLAPGATVSGRIVDAEGNPVRARIAGGINCPSERRAPVNLLWRLATTAADGSFTLPNLPAGAVQVSATAVEDGAPLALLRTHVFDGSRIRWRPRPWRLGGELDRPSTLQLAWSWSWQPTVPATAEPDADRHRVQVFGQLAGNGQAETGRLQVRVEPTDTLPGLNTHWAPVRSGTFQFDSLRRGRYRLSVVRAGTAPLGELHSEIVELRDPVHDLSIALR